MIKRLALLLAFLLVPQIALAAISWVGSCTGTTSCTMPAHVSGDVCIGFTFRDGNNTAPTVPTGSGWVVIANNVGAASNGSSIGYIIADSAAEVSGTWTSATSLIVTCWRGVHNTTPVGSGPADLGTPAGTTVSYLNPAMDVTDGTSWVVTCAGHRSVDTTLDSAGSVPTDFSTTNKVSVVDATDEVVCWNTNAGVTGVTFSDILVGGTSSGWRTRTIELLAAAAGASQDPVDPLGTSGFFGL